MSKKEKKPVVQAPVIEKSNEKPVEEAQVINPKEPFVQKQTSGMTIDSKVLYFATLHDRYGKNVPKDLENSPQIISGMNAIADAMAVVIAVEEAVNEDTVFHGIIQKNERAYASLQLMAKEYGVELPSLALLPAPTQEQLAAAGMVEANPDDKAVVKIDKSNVNEETKKKIAKEKEVTDSKPTENASEVKNEEQLQKSLLNLFIKGDRPIVRAKKAIAFMREYLKIQAAGNEEKIKAIDETSDVAVLEKVKDIIGDCPYKDSGISNFLKNAVSKSGTPIESFCTLYRSAKNRKTGELEESEEFIAAVCRVYVMWSCESTIKNAEKIIASEERQLKKLDENNKAHKDGIATIKKNIEMKNADIEYAKYIMSVVVNPDSTTVDNLIEAYNDDKHELHHNAISIFDAVLKTMYPNEDMTKYEKDCVEMNVSQYAGIIINLFRDSLSQLPNYSKGNLVELVKSEAEEEPKNLARGL